MTHLSNSNFQEILTQIPENVVIRHAINCLETRLSCVSECYNSSMQAGNYLQLKLGREPNEIFAVMFMNTQHKLIAFEKLFFGTVNSVDAYPRVIIQRALALNASNIILAHNHPSGILVPSQGDIDFTHQILKVTAILDIRLHDHFIVTPLGYFSFADARLLQK